MSNNLWKAKGVPKKNWIAYDVYDRGPNNLTLCQMCGEQHIRYEHHMQHANYKDLVVGCVCAENMSVGYKGLAAENLAKRKTNYLSNKWRVLSAVLSTHKINKDDVYIEAVENGFKWTVIRYKQDYYLDSTPLGSYATAEEAKEAVWQMYKDEGWL